MILVTGGTGLVGSHLLYFLVKRDKDVVRATHRTYSDFKIVKKVFSYYTVDAEILFNKIEWVECNITDIPKLTDAFKSITHVYHAAAYVDFNPKNYNKLKKINIEGTANIVNLCISNKIEKLCYVSSIATLGTPENNKAITEETQWNPETENSVYAITKYGAEMEVWRGTQEGVPAVIVNPGVILGEGIWNKGSGSIIKRINKGLKYYTTGGIGLVDVQDVVKAMILLQNNTIKNQRFVLVSESLSYKDFITKIAKYLNAPIPTIAVEKWKLILFSKLDWFLATFFGTKRKLLRTHVDSLYSSHKYNGSKIEKLTGFTYQSLDKTLQRVSENFKKEL